MRGFEADASHAVLIEVINALGVFREHVVIVGGWVPDLLYPNSGHSGSLDVDLAIAREAANDNAYQSILKRLTKAGYSHHTNPTRFTKPIAGADQLVKVDLICGQYALGEKAESIQLGELRISTLRGLDLAFEQCDYIEISGEMLNGALNSVEAKIVRAEAFILMKAFAMEDRLRDKDAYDIAFVLKSYRPDVEALGARVRRLLPNGLAKQGYDAFKRKFATIDSVGPIAAAGVERSLGGDYEQSRRAAFEYAQALIRTVDEPVP